MSNAPAARSLGDVLADIKSHRVTCADQQVPTSSDKLLELHTEALGLIEAHERAIDRAEESFRELLKRVADLEAAQAKPAAKTTKAR